MGEWVSVLGKFLGFAITARRRAASFDFYRALGFEALYGDDPDDLARLQSCAAAISRRGPALPGVKEYESWLESRMLYFEAAEDAKRAVARRRDQSEQHRRGE